MPKPHKRGQEFTVTPWQSKRSNQQYRSTAISSAVTRENVVLTQADIPASSSPSTDQQSPQQSPQVLVPPPDASPSHEEEDLVKLCSLDDDLDVEVVPKASSKLRRDQSQNNPDQQVEHPAQAPLHQASLQQAALQAAAQRDTRLPGTQGWLTRGFSGRCKLAVLPNRAGLTGHAASPTTHEYLGIMAQKVGGVSSSGHACGIADEEELYKVTLIRYKSNGRPAGADQVAYVVSSGGDLPVWRPAAWSHLSQWTDTGVLPAELLGTWDTNTQPQVCLEALQLMSGAAAAAQLPRVAPKLVGRSDIDVVVGDFKVTPGVPAAGSMQVKRAGGGQGVGEDEDPV